MRILLVIGMVLALAAPLYAESYSWVDDGGAFHFTDDYSRIPKKYRKKVIRRGDMSPEQQAPAAGTAADKAAAGESSKVGATEGKAAAKSDGSSQQLFGGKTEDTWRNELALQEQELTRLEGTLDAQRKQATGRISPDRFAELKKEYDETREAYKQKYEAYSKLLESAKKAGLTVEMKK